MESRRNRCAGYYAAPIVGFAVFVVVTALWRLGVWESFELGAYDWMAGVVSSPADEPRILLIEITESDIRRLGHWPVTDSELADIVGRVAQHRPRAIGIDIYRDIEVRDSAGNSGRGALAAAFHDYPFMVASMKAVGGSFGLAIPPPEFASAEQIGFSDIVLDHDGGVRRAALYLERDGVVYPSFALRVAQLFAAREGIVLRSDPTNPEYVRFGAVTFPRLRPDDGGYIGADTGGYQILLDPSSHTYRSRSLSALLQGDVPAEDIRGRAVLIGVTADSVPDVFLMPSARSNPATVARGLRLHAQAVEQLLDGALSGRRPITGVAEWLEVVLFLTAAVAGAACGIWSHSVLRFLGALVVGPGCVIAVGLFSLRVGKWVPIVPAALAWPLATAGATAVRLARERHERQLLMQLFRSHVSPTIAEAIWQQRDQVLEGGRARAQLMTASVLFSDIRGFSTLSEKLEPAVLQLWLSECIEGLAEAVLQRGGVIDKYIGDAVMAVFGVPVARTTSEAIADDAQRAVAAAFEMEQRLTLLNAKWRARRLPPVGVRIGICTGPVLAGSVGPPERLQYTVIGDTVNTAARLESVRGPGSLSDEADSCRILVAETTARLLDRSIELTPVGEILLKGKERPVGVYRIGASATHASVKVSDRL